MFSTNPQILVGYFCTTIFMLSRVPMLRKALRTRDLRSYSLAHLAMSASGNLLYWIYVAGLPVGPLWILQVFFTVTDLTMLTLRLSQRSRLSRKDDRRSAKVGSRTSPPQGIGVSFSFNISRPAQVKPMD